MSRAIKTGHLNDLARTSCWFSKAPRNFLKRHHSWLECIYVIVEKTSAPDNCHGCFWDRVAQSLLDNAAVSVSWTPKTEWIKSYWWWSWPRTLWISCSCSHRGFFVWWVCLAPLVLDLWWLDGKWGSSYHQGLPFGMANVSGGHL